MSSPILPSGLVASVSRTAENQEWDEFLLSTPQGSFSQTGMWAQTKEAEGWRTLRLVVRLDNVIGAGFQMLWKQKYGVRIGYVIKGPVLSEDAADAAADIVGRLLRLTRQYRILFLIVQPPDTGIQIPRITAERPFLRNHVLSVISANLVLNLHQGWDAVERRMRRTTRQEARRAGKMGLTIREGGVSDLRSFHQLMETTCRRLGTVPNPRNVSSLLAMWRAFDSRRCIRLTLAERDGRIVAGLLSVVFGQNLTFWKKGSDEQARSCHADQALLHEGIEWACRGGLRTCDFASMSRSTAEALLDGRPLPDETRATRDFLHLGFGGEPVLLSETRVYSPYAAFRAGYTLLTSLPQGRALLRRFRTGA